jgi:predicted CXXCH cytochrome family protein
MPEETAAGAGGTMIQYQLLAPSAAEGVIQPLANGAFASPHTDYTLATDACAACHRTHVAQASLLLAEPVAQATLCFTCHDGSGAEADIAAQYADTSLPANDEAERAYYRHDALLAPTNHTLASNDEFGGVEERHSECVDCHSSHNASPVDSVESDTGWSVSGRMASVSGVSVLNGAAGSVPTYTFLDGSVSSKPAREYEVCFKCHSSFTELPSNDGEPASSWWLDKGIELNPANTAFHPIEAPGNNASPAMAAGLLGTSPFKQWDFTPDSTIRCVNCHADSRSFDAAAPPTAGSALDNHASLERGILRQPYRDGRYAGPAPADDEGLKPAGQAYEAADFALCYMCHGEAGYVSGNPDDTSATNFGWHGYHLRFIENEGTGGRDIDTAGAGQGNAVCAECHFRIHSNALAVREGDRDNSRLVNFAPNVQPLNGTLEWAPQAGGGATCTLTCHGESHNAEAYPKP